MASGPMPTHSGSTRRGPRLSADPQHIAKRKRLIAEEFARDGKHAAIRKTISWGDIRKHDTDSPNKRSRTSLSQSITPGLSDMSTPTPMNRPRSSLKSSLSQRTPQHQSNTSTKRESAGKPSPILKQPPPQITLQSASRGTSPQRSQAQPEIINLVSDETSQSNERSQSHSNEARVEQASDLPSSVEQTTKLGKSVGSLAPTPPISEAGVQYQEQDVLEHNRSLSPRYIHSHASPRANVTPNLSASQPIPQATSNHLPAHLDSQLRRKRKTSNMGIQTIPDKDVDWLGDINADNSISAVEISRIWAEQRSGPKASEESNRFREPTSEPDEPLTGNFLDEVEGQLADEDEAAGDLSYAKPSKAIEDPNELNRQDPAQALNQDIPNRMPTSRSPSPIGSLSSGQLIRPSDVTPESYYTIPPCLQPGRKLAGATDRTDAPQVDSQPRPVSLSQPNPFVSETRARSRLYTPQPAPPSRQKDLSELRAAPTLGRSMLEATKPLSVSTNNGTYKTAFKDSDFKANTLKAAPTLGRSTDWGHASPSRRVTSRSNEKDGASGDLLPPLERLGGGVNKCEYSSSACYSDVNHGTKPHPRKCIGQGASLSDEFPPITLADLERRRRSSIASLAESKKIRREYDTIESNAVPQLRAHRDTYDESGRRTWVPKRPGMRRALDVPPSSTKKPIRTKYQPPVEESEEAEERLSYDPPESARESRTETFDPVPYRETMQEHQVETGGLPGKTYFHETKNRDPRPPTEISETPQSTRVRDPYDLATSELQEFQSQRFESEQPHHSAHATRNQLVPSPEVGRGSQPVSPQRIKLDGGSTRKASSRRKRPSSGLQIAPAPEPIWSPPRTRLSMGGRSGISVIEVSKSDQEILVQAGLRPILKRLSQAHGFTVEVVAEVYQEAGSLKDTEDTLERMKHSADKTSLSPTVKRYLV
ncbi:hypothetical protein RHS01_09174 [Rhizoctonia solani]|uniref:Uncharacterized protein n=1 Tax=Rhizoctonia solani TaxID=456999 RepID=A0A8H7I603_9AGAM|nr:hypothetical protein RHS01_09174 [Rhizoctonia solani]